MPDWSIKIVPAESPTTDIPAAFVPDLSGAQPGTPLTAQVDDIVTWNNTTDEDHWPWPVDYNGNPLPDAQVSIQFGNFFSEKIAAGMSSRPSYNVPSVPFSGTAINYCCKLHPKMLGQIRVISIEEVDIMGRGNQDTSLLPGEDPDLRREIVQVVGEEWLRAENTRLGGYTPEQLIGTPNEFRVRLVLRSIKSADLS